MITKDIHAKQLKNGTLQNVCGQPGPALFCPSSIDDEYIKYLQSQERCWDCIGILAVQVLSRQVKAHKEKLLK